MREEDAGKYECEGINNIGEARKYVNVGTLLGISSHYFISVSFGQSNFFFIKVIQVTL